MRCLHCNAEAQFSTRYKCLVCGTLAPHHKNNPLVTIKRKKDKKIVTVLAATVRVH